MLAMSVEVARRSTPVAGSTTLGAELPVTTTGPPSGIVRSNCGSRPRKVKLRGADLHVPADDLRRELDEALVVDAAAVSLEDLAGGRVVRQDADVLEDPQRRLVDPLDLLGGE